MDCPVCTEALLVVEREGIEVDWCLSCKGLWFDEGELELLAEKCGRQLEVEDLGQPPETQSSEKLRRCPRCDRKMEKVLAGPTDLVLVDRCRSHGFWLDRGELGKIIGQLAQARRADETYIARFLGETFESAAGKTDTD